MTRVIRTRKTSCR